MPVLASLSHSLLHLYVMRTDLNDATLRSRLVISDHERENSDRGVTHDDRQRRRVRFALRRQLLAHYLGVPRELVAITYDELGKPHVPGTLRFNTSYCADTMVLALGVGREIGVDVENLGGFLTGRFVSRHLSPDQMRSLAVIDDARARLAAARTWTRKEAVLKAIGTGLLREPRDIDVPTAEAIQQWCGKVADDERTWCVTDVAVIDPTTILTLAYERDVTAVRIEVLNATYQPELQ